jgi:hypothetical protein
MYLNKAFWSKTLHFYTEGNSRLRSFIPLIRYHDGGRTYLYYTHMDLFYSVFKPFPFDSIL